MNSDYKLYFRRIDLSLRTPWSSARTHRARTSSVIVVELTGPDKFKGFGEAAPINRYGEDCDQVEAYLTSLAHNSKCVNDIVSQNDRISLLPAAPVSALCALDVASLDLAAKLTGKSIHEYLGLPFQESKHVTSYTISIAEPAEIRRQVLAAGNYPVLKLKVGGLHDQLSFETLRDAAPSKPVRIDANEGWQTKELALERIEFFSKYPDVQFVEQPMPASTPEKDWAWLKAKSPLPIFADESYHFAQDAERAAECFHGVNVKLVKTGGITGAIDALRAARRQGLKTMLGCMIETSILISAAAHLASLCDYLDLDGNLLIANDPYHGVTADAGVLSFRDAQEKYGLRVSPR
ncbi:MAG TPA: dipeptide epimerase [Verrucomicrobiae bacterium]|nr:dipeptide epimerase [Verrucomicrobiae bacterium]